MGLIRSFAGMASSIGAMHSASSCCASASSSRRRVNSSSIHTGTRPSSTRLFCAPPQRVSVCRLSPEINCRC